MGTFASRQVVLLPFPFSDLSDSKLRPALVLTPAGRSDWVLCQITSKAYADTGAVLLDADDFAEGGLRLASYARPTKLFTASESLFRGAVGRLHQQRHSQVIEIVIDRLRQGLDG
ncbi:MAG: type II toxin-antitoxin system PemK/MazF family toxin [Rhodocyclaceae bacterium]|nr:type II toxin-antitoxin system PemK/MazF family toxin [Rhodocyclaceae bacterium]